MRYVVVYKTVGASACQLPPGGWLGRAAHWKCHLLAGWNSESEYGESMHILLGALGLIVTILVLVNRLSEAGIDIGWLDPFKWQRRRKWKKEYNTDPLFSIEDPKTATAGLMYAMVKCSGDISREE